MRYPIPLLFAAALLPALAGCGSKLQNAYRVQTALDQAFQSAQVNDDDKQARSLVDQAVAVAPNDPATYLGASDPNADAPGLSIAPIFQEVGDYPALADYMQQAVTKFPDDYRGYENLGRADDILGRAADRKATAAKLAAVLTKKLQTPGAQNIPLLSETLAQADFDAGDIPGGTAAYKKAIAAYPGLSSYPPGNTGPYNGLAYAEAEADTNLPDALAMAQQALALAKKSTADDADGQVAAIQDTLGWVQYRLKDYKDAEDNIQQAANVDPREPEIHYHLGMVYTAEGKTDAARTELGHAVLLAKGYAAARLALDSLPKASATNPAS